MNSEGDKEQVGEGYAFGQLAKAFVTALTHEDADTRARAESRAARWTEVLKGMATGKLTIGSRKPVDDLPAWVTPEVVRGGFATGAPAAGGPLDEWEGLVADRAGFARNRGALFAYYLTEPGLQSLHDQLESRSYRIRVPEESALLVMAWLVRVGDSAGALDLVEELRPFADRLRFAPEPTDRDSVDPSIVYRESTGEVKGRLESRDANARVETMREALQVWNPFADQLLELWLETVVDGVVGSEFPAGWRERAAALLKHYEDLAANHTRCRKHRNPKENVAILRSAAMDSCAGEVLTPRRRGLLRHAVNSMVARRGRPGSEEHRALRADQARNAAVPSHHKLARIVAARLGRLPEERGLESTKEVLKPVTPAEAQSQAIAAGAAIPRSIQRVVRLAHEGTPETLIDEGVVPSAEVLAELVPRIAGATIAEGYEDDGLQALMAAHYEAFRRRRTLLLLNLEHQVRIDELPWVQAVHRHQATDAHDNQEALHSLVRLSELTLDAFPATLVPSALVTELSALGSEAGLELPLLEELAADIFMGTFSAKFLEAAKLAGRMMSESLYEAYYSIDYDYIASIDDVRSGSMAARTSAAFDALCQGRAGGPREQFSVAANGMVIEQAQIVTTQNLATLAGPFGIGEHMTLDWSKLATACFERVRVLAERLDKNPRPLRTVKDLAYAWRQMVFFLSRLDRSQQSQLHSDFVDGLENVRSAPGRALQGPLADLGEVVRGEANGRTYDPAAGRPLLGWSVERHPLLAATR